MREDHLIVKQVYDAKEDMVAADELISRYLPFIKSETSKFLKRPVNEAQDDELSIAMMAFHEAIKGYAKNRGAFLSYAALLIKNRLIDYWRSNKKHQRNISIDEKTSGDDQTIEDSLTDGVDPHAVSIERQATKAEIEELSGQMEEFGVTLTDVAANCPKQLRTLEACKQVVAYAKLHSEIIDQLVKTKQLPIKALADGSSVSKKTIERHRKYLVALLLIYSNGYEIIRGHLGHMMKEGNA